MSTKINITMEEREALIKEIHANAVAKGFWAEDHSEHHYLMLVITELSEAVEADRKGRRSDRSAYEDALKDCSSAGVHSPAHFEWLIKDTVEDELADALIRIYDIVGAQGIDLSEEKISLYRGLALSGFEKYERSKFTEQVFICISSLINWRDSKRYGKIIVAIEVLAEHNGIDLYWHVREKMKYNAGRPPLHGKKY